MLNLLIEPTTGEITFGEFMAMSDTNNRWVYKGFLTTNQYGQIFYPSSWLKSLNKLPKYIQFVSYIQILPEVPGICKI
jgi:hypothetical protein